MFFEMRFDLGTLDSVERSLPFGLLVFLSILPFLVLFLPLLGDGMVDGKNSVKKNSCCFYQTRLTWCADDLTCWNMVLDVWGIILQ